MARLLVLLGSTKESVQVAKIGSVACNDRCINNTERRGSPVRTVIPERTGPPEACVHISRDETTTEVDILRPQISGHREWTATEVDILQPQISKTDHVHRAEATLIKPYLRRPQISGAAPSLRDKPQTEVERWSTAAVHREVLATVIKALPQASRVGVDFDEVATSVKLQRLMHETAEKEPDSWNALTAGRRVVLHDLKRTRHPGLHLANTVIRSGTLPAEKPTCNGDLAVLTEEPVDIDQLFSCWSLKEPQAEVPSWDLVPVRRSKAIWRRIFVMGLSFIGVISLAAALYGIVAYA